MLANVTTVEFVGPEFVPGVSYTDYYFICLLTLSVSDVSVSDIVSVFDVALTFDGKLDLSVSIKTTTASALEVTFTQEDFGQHFGQMVRHVIDYVSSWVLFSLLQMTRRLPPKSVFVQFFIDYIGKHIKCEIGLPKLIRATANSGGVFRFFQSSYL